MTRTPEERAALAAALRDRRRLWDRAYRQREAAAIRARRAARYARDPEKERARLKRWRIYGTGTPRVAA